MKYGKHLILIFVCLLSGCSLLSPAPNTPHATYVLNTLPATISKGPMRRPITLLVLPPDTRTVYNTTQMAYTDKPYQVAFFGLNQWVETPSQMFLPLIVQSLQNTRSFRAIVTPPYGGRSSYFLTTQILQLQQNFIRHPYVVELSVRAQLSKTITNQLIATKQFRVVVPIKPMTPYGGVIASNRAAAMILADLTDFCLAFAR